LRIHFWYLGAFLAQSAKNRAFRYNNAGRRYSASIPCAARGSAATGRVAFSHYGSAKGLYAIPIKIQVDEMNLPAAELRGIFVSIAIIYEARSVRKFIVRGVYYHFFVRVTDSNRRRAAWY
jgi:hypothetical protein